MERLPILGVYFDYKKQDVQEKIKNILNSKSGFFYITTPNPEIVLYAKQDNQYRMILNNADLNIVDGIGIVYAGIFCYLKRFYRITGVDLSQKILLWLEQNKYSLLIVNRKQGLSTNLDIKKFFQKNYPNIQVFVYSWEQGKQEDLFNFIKTNKPRCIFVNIGFPEQEKLLYKIKQNVHNINSFGIANGASIDFFIGKQKRAPKFLQKCGLEWFWRLITRPKRFQRIFNAVFKFSFYVIYYKIRSLFVYRKNVLGLILDKNNKILLIHLKEYDHWGFVQGGVEKREDLETALFREVEEEVGINKENLQIQNVYKNFYKYCWPKYHRYSRGFKGQKVNLFIIRYIGDYKDLQIDNYEVDDYKWVTQEHLLEILPEVRQNLGKKILQLLKD